MKWYRAGIMRKQFDILPTIFVRWFIGYQGTRKFDIGCSWLCFYFQTNQYGKDARKGFELMHKEFRKHYDYKQMKGKQNGNIKRRKSKGDC